MSIFDRGPSLKPPDLSVGISQEAEDFMERNGVVWSQEDVLNFQARLTEPQLGGLAFLKVVGGNLRVDIEYQTEGVDRNMYFTGEIKNDSSSGRKIVLWTAQEKEIKEDPQHPLA